MTSLADISRNDLSKVAWFLFEQDFRYVKKYRGGEYDVGSALHLSMDVGRFRDWGAKSSSVTSVRYKHDSFDIFERVILEELFPYAPVEHSERVTLLCNGDVKSQDVSVVIIRHEWPLDRSKCYLVIEGDDSEILQRRLIAHLDGKSISAPSILGGAGSGM